MPVSTRRRGAIAAAAAVTPSASTADAKRQLGIQAFARISKPNALSIAKDKLETPDVIEQGQSEPDSTCLAAGVKRCIDDDDDDCVDHKRQRTDGTVEVTTPRKQRYHNPQCLATPEATPRKTSKTISALPAIDFKKQSPDSQTLATPPASPTKHNRDQQTCDALCLPDELYELVQLNSALLRGLSLHFAHNGTASPIDLRLLRPSVTKIWGRRAVTTDDIRQCLGILHSESPSKPVFHIYDFEYNRICIERADESVARTTGLRPVDEERLNDAFEAALEDLWRKFHSELHDDEHILDHFIKNLPLEPIAPCPSLNKIKPRLLKGQQRLEDLKGVSLQRRAAEAPRAAVVAGEALARKSSSIGNRNSSLLARLRAKEELASSESKSEKAAKEDRRSTISRLHEIVPIISAPSRVKSLRSAQALPLVVQTVKDSAKNSLSSGEITQSLELLHRELGWTGFIDMIDTGGVVAVVVDRSRRPADWAQKLDDAISRV